jgi:hypothetical protein
MGEGKYRAYHRSIRFVFDRRDYLSGLDDTFVIKGEFDPDNCMSNATRH